MNDSLQDRTDLLASSLRDVGQMIHDNCRSIFRRESELSSQLHVPSGELLHLRGELSAFMSHSGFRARVCDPTEGQSCQEWREKKRIRERARQIEANGMEIVGCGKCSNRKTCIVYFRNPDDLDLGWIPLDKRASTYRPSGTVLHNANTLCCYLLQA